MHTGVAQRTSGFTPLLRKVFERFAIFLRELLRELDFVQLERGVRAVEKCPGVAQLDPLRGGGFERDLLFSRRQEHQKSFRDGESKTVARNSSHFVSLSGIESLPTSRPAYQTAGC